MFSQSIHRRSLVDETMRRPPRDVAVDPALKESIVADLRAYADEIKALPPRQKRKLKDAKCAKFAEQTGIHIKIIYAWAVGEHSVDEVIQIMKEDAQLSPKDVAKKHGTSYRTATTWRHQVDSK